MSPCPLLFCNRQIRGIRRWTQQTLIPERTTLQLFYRVLACLACNRTRKKTKKDTTHAYAYFVSQKMRGKKRYSDMCDGRRAAERKNNSPFPEKQVGTADFNFPHFCCCKTGQKVLIFPSIFFACVIWEGRGKSEYSRRWRWKIKQQKTRQRYLVN